MATDSMGDGCNKKKKGYYAKKNEGNSLFFQILHNMLTGKSDALYHEHIENPTFDDVYAKVGVEKALSKCFDQKVVVALAAEQPTLRGIECDRMHYWYLMKSLPRTFKGIDWKLNG